MWLYNNLIHEIETILQSDFDCLNICRYYYLPVSIVQCSVTIWQCAYLTVCLLPDSVTQWQYVYLTVRLSDSMAMWQYVYLTVWLSDSMAIWKYGYLTVWLSDSMAVWQYGCLTVWLYDSITRFQISIQLLSSFNEVRFFGLHWSTTQLKLWKWNLSWKKAHPQGLINISYKPVEDRITHDKVIIFIKTFW